MSEGQFQTDAYCIESGDKVELTFYTTKSMEERSIVIPTCQRAGVYRFVLHLIFNNDVTTDIESKLTTAIETNPPAVLASTNWSVDLKSPQWHTMTQELYVSRPTRLTLLVHNLNANRLEVGMFALHFQYI